MGLPYTGTLVLKPLADKYGVDIYQVRVSNSLKCNRVYNSAKINFVVLEMLAIGFGCVLRKYIRASMENAAKRHVFNVVAGFALGYLCYGPQLIHVLLQSLGCYLIMAFYTPKYSHL